MPTYKAILESHNAGGCQFSIVMIGDDILKAIEDYFERKEEVGSVLSITHPHSAYEYHIEHTGREEVVWNKEKQASLPKTFYFDTIKSISQLRELKKEGEDEGCER